MLCCRDEEEDQYFFYLFLSFYFLNLTLSLEFNLTALNEMVFPLISIPHLYASGYDNVTSKAITRIILLKHFQKPFEQMFMWLFCSRKFRLFHLFGQCLLFFALLLICCIVRISNDVASPVEMLFK